MREEDYVPKEIVPETETTRVETTRVSSEEQTGGEDRDSYGPTDEEIYGPGGGRFGIGSGNEQEKFGISLIMLDYFRVCRLHFL